METRTHVDVGHSRLAYRRVGQGPDLVLVHGWPLHSGTFRGLLPALERQFTCHLFDLPGAGETVCSAASPIDLASHALTLRAAVNELGLERYALLAHDSGGAVARLLAAEDERVAALVLCGTEIPGHHPLVITLLKAMSALPGAATMMGWMMGLRAFRASRLGFGSCFADPRHIEGEFHQLFVAPLLASPARAAGQFALIKNLDLELLDRMAVVHAKILAPTLLIWGEQDPIFPLAKAQAMVPQFAGGAELRALPGGKTFVHEEQPEAFLAHAVPFLARAFQRPSASFAQA
jgi:haloalkane dehalogenase